MANWARNAVARRGALAVYAGRAAPARPDTTAPEGAAAKANTTVNAIRRGDMASP